MLAQVLDLQQDFVLRNGLTVQMVVLGAGAVADHHIVQLLLGSILGVQAANRLAVLVDVDTVGKVQDLIQMVRNEDDGVTLVSDLLHLHIQILNLFLVQNGGRLVQQDQAVLFTGLLGDVHNLRNFDHLTGSKVQFADLLGGVDIGDVNGCQNFLSSCVHLCPVDNGADLELMLMTKEDVLSNVQVNDQGLLLENHADTGLVGIHRSLGSIGLAVEHHGAVSLGLCADDDLQQSGLTGAVFADQANDFAGLDFQLDTLQCVGTTKDLGNALSAENKFLSCRSLHFGAQTILNFTHFLRPPYLLITLAPRAAVRITEIKMMIP